VYWQARGARATVYVFERDLVHAEPALRAAADGFDRDVPAAPERGTIRAYLCSALAEAGRFEEARQECGAATATVRALSGDSSPALVWPLLIDGQLELRAHRPAAARAVLERAIALVERGGVEPIQAVSVRGYLAIAIALAHDRRPAEARALAIAVAPALEGPELAELRRDLGGVFPDLVAPRKMR
jgi:hypothetical protein